MLYRIGGTVRHWTARIFAAILLSLVCSAESNPQGDSIALNDSILLKDGYAFVDAVINGHGPFRMLIDTGTTTSLLNPDAAKEAGLVYDHRVIVNSLGGEKPFPATSVGELRVGSARASGLEIVASPIAQLRRIDRNARGVLGQNFLGRWAYLIDYGRKKLWLGEDARLRAEELPFVLSAQQTNGLTVLAVTLEAGRPAWRLTLDSGASHLLVKCGHRCPWIMDPGSRERVMTLNGDRPVQSGTLPQVEVAGATISLVHALLVGTEASDQPDEGVIPSQWFSAVYVDADSGLVRLSRAR